MCGAVHARHMQIAVYAEPFESEGLPDSWGDVTHLLTAVWQMAFFLVVGPSIMPCRAYPGMMALTFFRG